MSCSRSSRGAALSVASLSSISQGTDVERQPRSDRQALPETNNQSLGRSLTTFSTSSSTTRGL
jgi:hypothetical protein